jgi:hypothetical protein
MRIGSGLVHARTTSTAPPHRLALANRLRWRVREIMTATSSVGVRYPAGCVSLRLLDDTDIQVLHRHPTWVHAPAVAYYLLSATLPSPPESTVSNTGLPQCWSADMPAALVRCIHYVEVVY